MMHCLLDTHTFLWLWGHSKRLPSKARSVLEDPSNEVYLSAVSLWEVAIKLRSGRLDLEGTSAVDLISDAEKMKIQVIGIEPAEAVSHSNLLENTHFDPFDRMLIWQAISRKMTLVSGDTGFKKFKAHGLKLLWK